MSARRRLVVTLLVACMAAPIIGGAVALASTSQESLFRDDVQLVLSGEAAREGALDDIKALGADAIHSVVFWAQVAPRPTSRHPPAGFLGSDPGSYPPERWDKYDNLVRGARARG